MYSQIYLQNPRSFPLREEFLIDCSVKLRYIVSIQSLIGLENLHHAFYRLSRGQTKPVARFVSEFVFKSESAISRFW